MEEFFFRWVAWKLISWESLQKLGSSLLQFVSPSLIKIVLEIAIFHHLPVRIKVSQVSSWYTAICIKHSSSKLSFWIFHQLRAIKLSLVRQICFELPCICLHENSTPAIKFSHASSSGTQIYILNCITHSPLHLRLNLGAWIALRKLSFTVDEASTVNYPN